MVTSLADGSVRGSSPPDGRQTWRLRLYVRGRSKLTEPAIENIRAICDNRLSGDHFLEVIDIEEQPEHAADGQIIALPTLVRLAPGPVRRVIGDLADEQRVLVALNLRGTTE